VDSRFRLFCSVIGEAMNSDFALDGFVRFTDHFSRIVFSATFQRAA
jgi:hypothetical protein